VRELTSVPNIREESVSRPADLSSLQSALHQAGVEVYRTDDREIHIAERVRFHIMDSGIRLRLEDNARVSFTARSQRSDFPNELAEQLFERVRSMVGQSAGERGYAEADAKTIKVLDPVDASRVLDVWHEVTYEKDAAELADIIDEIRWALSVDKYVAS
jgi:hypothetical protein